MNEFLKNSKKDEKPGNIFWNAIILFKKKKEKTLKTYILSPRAVLRVLLSKRTTSNSATKKWRVVKMFLYSSLRYSIMSSYQFLNRCFFGKQTKCHLIRTITVFDRIFTLNIISIRSFLHRGVNALTLLLKIINTHPLVIKTKDFFFH